MTTANKTIKTKENLNQNQLDVKELYDLWKSTPRAGEKQLQKIGQFAEQVGEAKFLKRLILNEFN